MQKIKKSHKDTTITSNETNVLLLACAPIPLLRVAFIGLGKRGKESLVNYTYIEGVEIKAICDLNNENLLAAQKILNTNNCKPADEYNESEDWRKICKREDIDLMYVCTNINLHAEIAIYAMEHGKHVAVEVPIANTITDCWRIVDTAEKYRRHCIMLENCCYGRLELAALNMHSQGLLGDIIHAEGGYIHDLRHIDFKKRPEYAQQWTKEGNPYPTHGLGPLCQAMNIHRGDRLSWLVSVSNGQFNYPDTGDANFHLDCVLGNINTTIIKTEKQKTILIQHDISSPRPYCRNYLLSGTQGFVRKGEPPIIQLAKNTIDFEQSAKELLEQYEHPFYDKMGETAKHIGAHDGMDFIMDYRLVYCLQKGLPLDMDVYDAVEWSCLVELTAISIQNGSIPIEIPDFTRGAWNNLNGLHFAE